MLSGAILRKTKVFSQSKTAQYAAVLISGKAGLHLIALFSQPLLTRLYSPAQFGEFAFFNSIMAIIFIAASGRYEAGIVLTKTPAQAGRLFQLSQYVLIAYTLSIVIFLIMIPEYSKQWFFDKGFTPFYLWAIPAMIIFSGYWQIVNNWLIRFQKFSMISLTLFIQRIVILMAALAAFYLPVPGNGLIFSMFIGFLVIFMGSVFIKPPPFEASFRNIKQYAFHFRDFPFFSAPTLFINLFMIHLPVLWITFFYSKENAGSFSLAYTLISVPVQFLHVSLGQIFYQRLAQTRKSLRYPLLLRYCKLFILFLIPGAIIATIFGEQLCRIFLGDNWSETGKMVSIMALLMIIQGLSGLFMYVINVMRKQQLSLLLQIVQFMLWITAFSAGLYFHDIFLSLRLIVILSALHLVYTIFWVKKLILSSHDSYSHRTLANG